MEYAIAKVSTKGQIVIPAALREGFEEGSELLIVKDEGRMIFKTMKSLASSLKEDFIFAERVEKAWRHYDKGTFETRSKEDFLKALRAC